MYTKIARKSLHPLLIACLLVGLGLISASAQAEVQATGAVIVVDSTDDEWNINGVCTLREAIDNASFNSHMGGNTDCAAGSGDDTITFDPSLAGQTITFDLYGQPFFTFQYLRQVDEKTEPRSKID